MKVVHIASECAPFSHEECIGQFLPVFTAALAENGMDVTVVTPMYGIPDPALCQLTDTGLKTWIPADDQVYEYEIWTATRGAVKHVLLKNDYLFGRKGMYRSGSWEYSDNHLRFGTFVQAALNWVKYHAPDTDAIHAHGWQAGLAPVYLRLQHPELTCGAVYTIHDISEQGVFNRYTIEALNLPWDIYHMDGIEYHDNVNFQKAGIVFADKVTVVSRTYAEEILQPEHGFGLDGVMRKHQNKTVGISCGIDDGEWNPETDASIPRTFSSNDLQGKRMCKEVFAKAHDFSPELPLFAVLGRLEPHRGIDLIMDTFPHLADLEAIFFIQGQGDARYQAELKELESRYPNVRVHIGCMGAERKNLFAASDFIMMPSPTEPCGTIVMNAMRYGVVPVVHHVGGLKDIIGLIGGGECGLAFYEYSVEALTSIIRRALSLFSQKEQFAHCARSIMRLDLSWDKPAELYRQLYQETSEGRKQ